MKSMSNELRVFVILIFLGSLAYSIPAFPTIFWENIPSTQDINYALSGNVGIGVQKTMAKLDVNGNIKLADTGTKPLCNNRQQRGTLWFTKSDVNGDKLEICTYNPEGNITETSMQLLAPRAGQSCVRSSDQNHFYCFGGTTAISQQVNIIVKINTTLKTVVAQNAVLPTALTQFACAENDRTRKIYCFGGSNPNYTNLITEYNPITDTIVTKNAVLPVVSDAFSCAQNSLTHKIYCFGGNTTNGMLNHIIEYDSNNDTITVKNAVLPYKKSVTSCVENTATHLIYCFGGNAQGIGPINDIVEYNSATDTLVTKTAKLQNPSQGLSCTENNLTHEIYCYGGTNFLSITNEIEKYNPATNTVKQLESVIPIPTAFADCLKDYKSDSIYCFGGITSLGFSNRIIQHNFNTLEWKKV